MNKFLMIALLASASIFTACNDKTKEQPKPLGKYEKGLFVSNEGNFGDANGSISYYNPDTDELTNEIFKLENNRPLGDVVQSITVSDAKYSIKLNGVEKDYVHAVICVNNSNKVELVNALDFKEIATIDIDQPRYAAIKEDKAYVSSWADGGTVKIIDLLGKKLLGSIDVGNGPEAVVITNDKLYVANSGGFGEENTISVVDLSTNAVSTITLNAINPTALTVDKNGNLWVLAKGSIIYDANWQPVGHKPASLVKIDTFTDKVVSYLQLFADKHPSRLAINAFGDKLYYGGGWGFQGVFALPISATAVPVTPLIDELSYGFFVDKSTDEIFLLQEASNANGKLIRYKADGTKIKEYEAGIFPNGGGRKK